jgi:hypothetical protein
MSIALAMLFYGICAGMMVATGSAEGYSGGSRDDMPRLIRE